MDRKIILFKDVEKSEFIDILYDKINEYLNLSNQTIEDNRLKLIIERLQYYLQTKQYKNFMLMELDYIFEQAFLGKWKEKRISFQNIYSWFNEYYRIKVDKEEYEQRHQEFKNPLSRLDNSLFAKALKYKYDKAMQLKLQGKDYNKIMDIPLKSIFNNLKAEKEPFENLL